MTERFKIKAKNVDDFNEIILACKENGVTIHVASPKRLMVSTSVIPDILYNYLLAIGLTIVPETQYDMDE